MEQHVSTLGPWIAFEASSVTNFTGISIKAVNMDTGMILSVVGNGSFNQRPNISGDLLSYESNILGYFQIFVYRLAEGDTFQATSSTYDERLNEISGNLVTYVDPRTGNYNVFASALNFIVPPIANAGQPQTVQAGHLVTLDGSGSSDPSGLPLTYAWSILSKPSGSAATLTNAASVSATFTADQPGDFQVQLIVADTVNGPSLPTTVKISTTNTAPIADPGSNQLVTQVGSTVQLDGTQSYDPDGDPITYLWSFITKPTGSSAILPDATSPKPTFVADIDGTYVIQLLVSDPWIAGAPQAATVSFNNVKPVANAGTAQAVVVGNSVTLNGSASYDANLLPLTYQWSLVKQPSGSTAVIGNPTLAVANFTPDQPGAYVAQLIVQDAFLTSDPSTVQVQAAASTTEVVQQTQALQSNIASLNPGVVKNANMRNALNNKLNAVIANIESGNYAQALQQLQGDDLLGKMDGCATTGAPDKNDWIITCAAQNQVYPYVTNLAGLVKSLMQ